jgi:hypothetical protein
MPVKKKIPKALSVGEETFALHCNAAGMCPVREHVFAEGRKFSFDFAWPRFKLAVEIEGGTRFGMSRHSRGEGFERDCRKYNLAARLGWVVFRYTTQMVKEGIAITDVESYLKEIQ